MRSLTGRHLDNGSVLGTDFARTLRAAQAGEEAAFVRLWRDANPAMVRYLRVVGHDDPYDEACEGWMTVVRGLPQFAGDETDWRAWLLACARQRAEDSTLRRSWGASAGTAAPLVEGDGDIDIDELLEPSDAGDPADPGRRGISDTLAALRGLPLGQGEVVVLRLGADLPPPAVAQVVGVDEDVVERAEARALERLDTQAELLSWSLKAPASPAELADEQVALGAFRTVLARARAEKVKVIAIGASGARAARQASSAAGSAARGTTTRRGSGSSRPGRAGTDPRGGAASRSAAAVGRSRSAALALTALSLSVVSVGGFAAAAYVGVLPAPVQQAVHDAVGAPAPGGRDAGSTRPRQPGTSPTAGIGQPTGTGAAAGLCRAWSTDQAKGAARERSAAFQKLATAAGGPAKVQAYCATALAQKPGKGAPTASVGGTAPHGPATKPGKGNGATPRSTTKPTHGKPATTGKVTVKATGKASGKATSTGRPASTSKPTTAGKAIGSDRVPSTSKPSSTDQPTSTVVKPAAAADAARTARAQPTPSHG